MAWPIQESIYHGVDTKVFRPIEVTKTNAFGRDTPESTFMVGIFKNNRGTRWKPEIQLEGFRLFLDQLRDKNAKLYIHCNKLPSASFDVAWVVKKFGLTGHVYLVNQGLYRYGLPEEDLNMMYNACDVILNAVAGEGFGLPILEAFACKKPVIAVGFSSMPELLSGIEGEIKREDHTVLETERGWLVGTSNKEYTLGKQSARRVFKPEDIAEALMLAYENPKKRKEKGEAAYKWVQQYDWERIGDQWIEYLNGLEKRMKKTYSWSTVKNTASKNKLACALFSFNRPTYLAQTLDSLAKNTLADKVDFYIYQDGPLNPDIPYTTAEDEKKNIKLTKLCMELLVKAPFKHKKIFVNKENAGYGRQVQQAYKLFEKYDNVFFTDDDHVVSKDYIKVLLKLHKQFPDAIVGAQATEEKNIPKVATLDEIGITTTQIQYVGGTNIRGPSRPGRWRYLGYLMPKDVYLQVKDQIDEYIEFIGPSYQSLPHRAVCIKWGVLVSGIDGVLDKILDGHAIPRIATVIPRAKYIGKQGMFGNEALFKAMGFDHNLRYEFEEDPIKHFGGIMIEDLRDKHKGKEIWIIGAGPSADDFPADFFRNKIAIALDVMAPAFPNTTYIHTCDIPTSEWIRDNKPKWLKKLIVTRRGSVSWSKYPQVIQMDFNGLKATKEDIRLVAKRIAEGRSCCFRNVGTIAHSAIEIAAVLGAKKITLVGCEAKGMRDRFYALRSGVKQQKSTEDQQKGTTETFMDFRNGTMWLAEGLPKIQIARYYYKDILEYGVKKGYEIVGG